jgi:hypothetical protein
MARSVHPLWFLGALLLALPAAAVPGDASRFDEVTVEKVRTSIYIGTVTLRTPPLSRENGSYHTTYRATVFPYFFHNEHGTLSIDLSDQQLEHLVAGHTVEFTGRAMNSDGEPREVTGRAQPDNANEGKLKVRVRVSPKIELIFNTTYRFTG